MVTQKLIRVSCQETFQQPMLPILPKKPKRNIYENRYIDAIDFRLEFEIHHKQENQEPIPPPDISENDSTNQNNSLFYKHSVKVHKTILLLIVESLYKTAQN